MPDAARLSAAQKKVDWCLEMAAAYRSKARMGHQSKEWLAGATRWDALADEIVTNMKEARDA